MDAQQRFPFKILVLGEAGVGKTCLLRRFTDDRFSAQTECTIGFDFRTCSMEVSGNSVRLEVWDTAGEERYHALRQSFYRGTHGILLVYDITWGASFRNAAHWLHEVHHHCPSKANILLVGNKCDALERREVTYEEGHSFAQFCGISFAEVSAMSGANVKTVFANLAVDICRRLLPARPALEQPPALPALGQPPLLPSLPAPPDSSSDDDTFQPRRQNRISLANNGQQPGNQRSKGCCNT